MVYFRDGDQSGILYQIAVEEMISFLGDEEKGEEARLVLSLIGAPAIEQLINTLKILK